MGLEGQTSSRSYFSFTSSLSIPSPSSNSASLTAMSFQKPAPSGYLTASRRAYRMNSLLLLKPRSRLAPRLVDHVEKRPFYSEVDTVYFGFVRVIFDFDIQGYVRSTHKKLRRLSAPPQPRLSKSTSGSIDMTTSSSWFSTFFSYLTRPVFSSRGSFPTTSSRTDSVSPG